MTLEALFRRDRLVVGGGLVSVSALAWVYLLRLNWAMDGMKMSVAMAAPLAQGWNAIDLVLLFVMWSVMMIAMMVPSAAPMIVVFAQLNRQRQERENPAMPTALFLAAYLVVWAGFSAVAMLAQWGLHSAALLSPMMVSTSPVLGGLLLIAAGGYQWTSLKRACLVRCRSPLAFLLTEWRDGRRGAFLMGLKHGLYCLGCCSILMALLFVAGVMNLLWVTTIAAFILAEKVLPRGDVAGRLAGAVLVLAGFALLAQWSR